MTESLERPAYHALNTLHLGNYEKLTKLLARHGSWRAAAIAEKIETNIPAYWKKFTKLKIQLILNADSSFPPLLRQIPYPPHALYFLGNLPTQPAVAIVGTRKATIVGRQIAKAFAKTLTRHNFGIISGLALGVDGAAHEGALAGSGYTAAVLACGLDMVYPNQHAHLAKEILDSGGALISEYPPTSQALPRFFLERNRLVSGLAKAVIIIEAPKRSGTLATARFAVDQNREVFVVPGNIQHPNYEGSNELLKQGAALITNPEDVLEAMGLEGRRLSPPEAGKLAKNEQLVLNVLTQSGKAVSIEELLNQTKLEASVVNQALTTLLLAGLVSEEQNLWQKN